MPSADGEYRFREDLLSPEQVLAKFRLLLDGALSKSFEVPNGSLLTLTDEKKYFALQVSRRDGDVPSLYDLTFSTEGKVNPTATVCRGQESIESEKIAISDLPFSWQSILSVVRPLDRDPFEVFVAELRSALDTSSSTQASARTIEAMTELANTLDAVELLERRSSEVPDLEDDDPEIERLARDLIKSRIDREQLADADSSLSHLDFGCSIMWNAACEGLGLPLRKFSSTLPPSSSHSPIPTDLRVALEDRPLERIMKLEWQDKSWLVVDLTTRGYGRPRIGQKLKCDDIMSLKLTETSHFEGI